MEMNVDGVIRLMARVLLVMLLIVGSIFKLAYATDEPTEYESDDVSIKAGEICDGLIGDACKVAEIYNFIYTSVSYDYDLADDVKSGRIKTYVPNAAKTLNSRKGICYDYSLLFKTMCESQGIHCEIVKGYYGTSLHSWNRVYVGEKWYTIDSTIKLKYNLENDIFFRARRQNLSRNKNRVG